MPAERPYPGQLWKHESTHVIVVAVHPNTVTYEFLSGGQSVTQSLDVFLAVFRRLRRRWNAGQRASWRPRWPHPGNKRALASRGTIMDVLAATMVGVLLVANAASVLASVRRRKKSREWSSALFATASCPNRDLQLLAGENQIGVADNQRVGSDDIVEAARIAVMLAGDLRQRVTPPDDMQRNRRRIRRDAKDLGCREPPTGQFR
jgi:hypothetical protein